MSGLFLPPSPAESLLPRLCRSAQAPRLFNRTFAITQESLFFSVARVRNIEVAPYITGRKNRHWHPIAAPPLTEFSFSRKRDVRSRRRHRKRRWDTQQSTGAYRYRECRETSCSDSLIVSEWSFFQARFRGKGKHRKVSRNIAPHERMKFSGLEGSLINP